MKNYTASNLLDDICDAHLCYQSRTEPFNVTTVLKLPKESFDRFCIDFKVLPVYDVTLLVTHGLFCFEVTLSQL